MTKLIDINIIKSDLLLPIAEKYNIPCDELFDCLDNITRTRIVKSKYSCDHDFFSKNNELSFYWAGFIAADGCVHKRGNNKTLHLNLAEKDLNHLLKFKNDINFNGPTYSSTTKHSETNPKWKDSIKNSISISSFQIFEDLKRFGIVQNKTKILLFPKWMFDHKLVNHFMRGYLDGDGCFYYDKKRRRLCIELRGTGEFLYDYKDIICKNITNKCKVNVTEPDSTAKLKYSGKKIVPEIVEFLYNDATVFLQRKYDIAKQVL